MRELPKWFGLPSTWFGQAPCPPNAVFSLTTPAPPMRTSDLAQSKFSLSHSQILLFWQYKDCQSVDQLIITFKSSWVMYEVYPEKVQPLLIWQEWFVWHRCNLAAKESGLECACVNNDNGTVLGTGGGRHLSEHVYCVAIAFKMTEQVEQRICIKFCVNLEHSSAETIQMIHKAFRDDQWVQCKWKCGTNTSKVVENLLKMIHVLEGLQPAEHLRMFNVYELQSTKIGDWQCEN